MENKTYTPPPNIVNLDKVNREVNLQKLKATRESGASKTVKLKCISRNIRNIY